MRALLTMTLSDLRQRVRDKSVLVFAIVVPLALMSVFNLVFADLEEPALGPVTVAAAAPEGDELAAVVIQALRSLEGSAAVPVTVQEAEADAVPRAVESGEADMGLVVPEGFGAAVSAGEPVAIEAVEGDDAGVGGQIVLAVVHGVLEQLAAGTVAATAGAQAGLSPAELGAVAQEAATGGPEHALVQGQTSDEQLGPSASMVAGQAGLFLMFTVSFGVLGLVIERNQGTLARLQSMPMNPVLIVLAKALVSVVLGVTATTVLLTAGTLLFDVDFGHPALVAVLIVAAVVATTSVMLVVARVARTAEQANGASSILALVLGFSGGAFFPVSAPGVVGTLLDLNPVAAFIRGLGITSGGGGMADLGTPLLVLGIFAAVMVTIARLVPDRGAAA